MAAAVVLYPLTSPTYTSKDLCSFFYDPVFARKLEIFLDEHTSGRFNRLSLDLIRSIAVIVYANQKYALDPSTPRPTKIELEKIFFPIRERFYAGISQYNEQYFDDELPI
jgi:hypothetical protein